MLSKGKLIHALMFLKNHNIKKHIIVFESDDWGVFVCHQLKL